MIEDKASGTALIQELKYEGVYGIECYQPQPGSDKFMRFAAQAIKFESGRVYLPSQAHWLNEYVREITGFPGSKHDDQVDSTSQALDYLGTKASDLEVWARNLVILDILGPYCVQSSLDSLPQQSGNVDTREEVRWCPKP